MNDARDPLVTRGYAQPEPTPAEPHVAVYCAGCRHAWWADEECSCSCRDGDPAYERWIVGPQPGEALGLLGPARMVLDRCAERTPGSAEEAADMAQRIVDVIGHPATDEPAHAIDVVRRLLDDWSYTNGQWRSDRFDEASRTWFPVHEPATDGERRVIEAARHGY